MAKTTNIVPEGWTLREAESLYDRLRTPRVYDRNQVNQSGKYPIIDQSESGCIGYLDEIPDFDCSQDMPLTTFANHTCAVRQMKRPFGVIQNVFPLKAKPDVSQHFLYQIINRAIPQNGYKGHYPELRETQFLTPPLPEQQKIATILSSVDDVIEKTRAQIDKLKDLKTGMMQELLTKGVGHTEFKDSPVGRIPTSWKVIPLEELCSKVSVGIASSTTHAYCSSGVPLLRNQNILPSGIRRTDILYISQKFSEENSSKKIHTGDVITVRTGYPGISAVVPEEFNNCHSFTTLISRPKPAVLNSHYLSLVINSDYGKNFVVGGQAGGAQQNLNATTLKIFPVILPPLREQVAIFEIVNSVSEKISLSIKKLGAMNSVKKALMQDLLTGKVRVKLTDKESAAS